MSSSDLQYSGSASSTCAHGDASERWAALKNHMDEVERALEQRRKNRGKKFRLAWVGCFVSYLGGCGIFLGTPETKIYDAPNGQYSVETIDASLLSRIVGPGTVRVELINKKTKHRVTVLKTDSEALLAGDCSPSKIIWRRDSKSFLFIYTGEANGGNGNVYNVRKPLSAPRDATDTPWVKQELSARVHRGIALNSERYLLDRFNQD